MENQQSKNSGLKAIIVILVLSLIGSLGYMYKLSNDSKDSEKVLLDEKESVLKDLAIAKDSLNKAIESNTSLSDQLIVERDKIQQLMSELEQVKSSSTASIFKYKEEAMKLRSSVNNLVNQVRVLKSQNSKLINERDSTALVLTKARKFNDTLVGLNTRLASDIEKASKLSVLNLQVVAVKQKSSGKLVETDKASRADVLKISFMIAENRIAKSGDKKYYVQVIDLKNNVLGERKTEYFGTEVLDYSFISVVKYENKTVKVEKDLPVSDIKEGTYFVNVYDGQNLVSKTSFVLR